MKKYQLVRSLLIEGLLAIAVALTGLSLAQSPTAQSSPGPRYDTSTEITLTGSVQAVVNTTSPKGWGGTHLRLKTEKEVIDVHAGPSWYLAEKKIVFTKGDQIAVTGSRVKFEGSDALIAREIKKGNETVSLRDTQGIPLWSGGPGHRR